MSLEDVEEPQYPVDQNAHVYAWKQYADEEFQKFLYRRSGRAGYHYRRSPKEWLQDKLYERRRRNERLDTLIEEHERRFFECVSKAKPYADHFSLFSLHMLLSGLFFALTEQLIKGPWSNRTAAALLFVTVYSIAMFRAFSRANDAFIDMAVLKVFRLLNLQNPPDIDWKSVRVIWALTFVLLHWGVIAGSSFVGYDLSRRVIEQLAVSTRMHDQVPLP